MPNDDIIDLVDDGTGTFVPSGKVSKKRVKRKAVEQEQQEQFSEQEQTIPFAIPPQFIEPLAPLMERQNFRGAKPPIQEFFDGMEMGTQFINQFINILAKAQRQR